MQPNRQDSLRGNAIIATPRVTLGDILLKTLKIGRFGSVSVVDRVEDLLDQLDWSREPVDLIVTQLRLNEGDAYQLINALGERKYSGSLVFIEDGPPILLESATMLAESMGLKVVGAYQPPFRLAALLEAVEAMPARSEIKPEPDLSPELSAFEDWRIEAVYQPKVSLRNGEIVGFEALARWNHPEHGLLSPSYFLSRAEQACLIDDLTLEVLRQGLSLLRSAWSFAPRASLSVNVSATSLAGPGFPERIRSLVESEGIRPSRIILEITETQIMRNDSHALLNVDRLGLMGFGLSLDDYGTGYSSLARLSSLPFSELKVDRRFCNGASQRSSLQHILRNCTELARDLGLKIVAEGVETEADRLIVQRLGFDSVQGYIESRPLTRDRLLEWLEDRTQPRLARLA